MATYYDNASLVMIPSGYKDDKLYSIKPTDGTGDFTFSRDGAGASPATRVNASGLIEKGRENLAVRSNDFDNWNSNASISFTSGQSGYDGSSDAWKLDLTAAGGRVQNSNSTSGVHTFSVYAKAGTLNWVRLITNSVSTQDMYFDLANGVLGTSTYGGQIDATITSVGGGWYRCTLTDDKTLYNIRIYPAQGDGDLTATSGNIYIQDAQLEQGLVATSVIETTTAPVSAGLLGDMPRLDYSGGATCPSLLLEPSRTNAVTQSEYFDGGSLTNTTISAEYNTADTLSPEGVYNAAKLTATGSFPRYYNFPSTSDNTDIVISSFAKAGDASVYSLFASDKNLDAAQVYFDLSAGTATLAGTSVLTPAGYDIEPMGNGWYRCWLSINTGTGASSVQIRPIAHAQGQSGGWSGSNYIYAYGAQLEAGSYPTSYIPTYGSASTRGNDSMNVTSATDIIGQSEGTMFVEYDQNLIGQSATRRIMALTDGGILNRIVVYVSSSNKIDFYVRNSSGNLFLGTSTNVNTKGVHKIAAAYKNGDYIVYLDGVEIISGSGTAGTIPACNRIDVGSQIGANPLDEPIKQALLFKTRLTNAELAALTA